MNFATAQEGGFMGMRIAPCGNREVNIVKLVDDISYKYQELDTNFAELKQRPPRNLIDAFNTSILENAYNQILSDPTKLGDYIEPCLKDDVPSFGDLELKIRERLVKSNEYMGGRKYTKNLCKKKSTTTCKNVKGCKIASGSMRTYCRKTKNNILCKKNSVSKPNTCKKKSVSKPNTCKKNPRCKVASGTKRTYCRKAHNKTHKKK
jgi:hypothetical protein